MSEADRAKTAFYTNRRLFQFWVMPFGMLCNMPLTFERLMDAVLEGLQGKGYLVYLDDIVAYGQTFSEYREYLVSVLQRLGDAGPQD